MKRELENELAPIIIDGDVDVWKEIFDMAERNQGRPQPVVLRNPANLHILGELFVSLVNENGETFFQFHDFNSFRLEQMFVQQFGQMARRVQPGILRVKV